MRKQCIPDPFLHLFKWDWGDPFMGASPDGLVNCLSSGWQIDMMRLADGIAGSVENTAFSFDAVIRPVLIRNQRRELAWPLQESILGLMPRYTNLTPLLTRAIACAKPHPFYVLRTRNAVQSWN